jgi:Flp pilus assembly protein TadD
LAVILSLALLDLVDLHQPLAAILHGISRKSFIATPVTNWDYLLTQFVVWVTYLRLLVLPIHQNLDYDFPIYHSVFDPAVILSLLLLAALLGLVVWLVKHYRQREPAVRLVAFGAGLFFLGPLVESSFMPMIDVINEHRLYLAAAGFFTAVAVGVIWGAVNRAGRRPYLPGVAALVLLALAGTYGVATYCRNQVWQSEISLWRDVVRKSPGKARPYNELGLAYVRQGQNAQAIPFYQKAIALNPGFANYYNNLGQVYLNMGDSAKAQEMFNLALSKERDNYFAINNLGVIYLRQQRLQEAKEMFSRALRISPGYTIAQSNLQLVQRLIARKP